MKVEEIILTVNEYLDIIRPYLVDITNDHKVQSERKIQLTIAINFISSKPDSDETRTMRAKSHNIEIMIGSETNEIIEDLFKSLLQKYQKGLEESMRESEFIFDGVDALYYDLSKVSLSRGESYKDFPEWLKNKKATINSKNNDDKCFQYALTLSLNHKQIKKDLKEYQKLNLFLINTIGKKIDFPTSSNSWKKFETNNESIALNILYVLYNTKELRHAYKSKYNLRRENQLILLMITDGKKWHYLVVESLSALLRGITSKHEEDFYCLNCFRSYTTENKLKKHKNVCKNHDYWYVEMPEDDNKILKYNHGEKPTRAPFAIYADLECLLEKMSTCRNNSEKSSTPNVKKHIPSGYSLLTCCSFDTTKTKLDYYRGEDCMKEFCKDLKEHATKIINYEKKEMIPLTKEEKTIHRRQKCYICKKRFSTDDNNKKHHKVKDHCHYAGK